MYVAALFLAATLAQSTPTAAPSRPTENLIREYYRAFSNTVQTGEIDPKLRIILAPEFVERDKNPVQGRANYEQYLLRLHDKLPSLNCVSTDMVEEGERVAVRTQCWIMENKLQPRSAIGVDMFRIHDGQIIEHSDWTAESGPVLLK